MIMRKIAIAFIEIGYLTNVNQLIELAKCFIAVMAIEIKSLVVDRQNFL